MQLHEALREGEPKAGPLARSFRIAADLAEFLEDPLLILRGYPDAGVANGHGGRAVLARRGHVHASAVRCELHGVRKQVVDDLLDFALVASDLLEALPEIDGDSDVVTAGALTHHRDAVLQCRPQ